MKSRVLLLAVVAAVVLAFVASATMWATPPPLSIGNADQFGVLSFYGAVKFNQVAEVDPAYVPTPPICPGTVGCEPDTGAVNIGASFHDYLYGDAIASLSKGIAIFMGPKNQVAGECVTGGGGVLLGSLSDCAGGIDKSGSNSKVTTLLPAAIADAKTFSLAASGLTATQTLAAINLGSGQNNSITTQAGLNVIDLPSIITKGKNTITITAGATDAVIFNIGSNGTPGKLVLGPSTQVVLSGGITPDRVLFNVLGNGGYPISVGNGSYVRGTILAPYDGIDVSTELGANPANYYKWTVIDGALIAGKDIYIGCLVKIYFYPFSDLITSPTPTPTGTPIPGTPTPTPTPNTTACLPSSSIGVLVSGKNVAGYIPKASWGNNSNSNQTGIGVIQVEGSVTSGAVTTTHPVNSCASNSVTGETVCVSNTTDVYLLNGTTLSKSLTDGATGTNTATSGGACETCGVSLNELTNQAVLTEGQAVTGDGAYQFLNLNNNNFSTPVTTGNIPYFSEEILVDPVRNLILAAGENGTYEIADTSGATLAFYENKVQPVQQLDSSAEDCSTGIALAGVEFHNELYLSNLNQKSVTAGSPAGTWNAPGTFLSFPEFSFPNGATAVTIAQGSHTGIVASEFGGNLFGAIQLPASAGTGTPSVLDYVACNLPNEPAPVSGPFEQGFDPHTVTAYVSPNSGDAIGLSVDKGPNFVAMIDLTKLLDTSIVPRTAGTHSCDPSVDLVAKGVVTYIQVP